MHLEARDPTLCEPLIAVGGEELEEVSIMGGREGVFGV